jgi:hypothetical protein
VTGSLSLDRDVVVIESNPGLCCYLYSHQASVSPAVLVSLMPDITS